MKALGCFFDGKEAVGHANTEPAKISRINAPCPQPVIG
jgi:hypothetical protein